MKPSGQASEDSVDQPSLSEDGRYLAANCLGHDLLGTAVRATKNSVRLDREKAEFELVRTDGAAEPVDDNLSPFISGDGQHVAYCTWHSRDGSRHRDVFVRDYQAGRTDLCSAGMDFGEPLGDALQPVLSRDGRVVVFEAEKRSLAPGPASRGSDIYAYDRITHETSAVSVSDDGHRANATSSAPSISADGRFVAFSSRATNLVDGDTNRVDDVFVRDRQQGRTVRVSVTSAGGQADGDSFVPGMSADGRFVAFETSAPNLGAGVGRPAVCVHDLQTGQTETLALPESLVPDTGRPALSGDGRYLALLAAPSTGGPRNVYVYDRSDGHVACVSATAAGETADAGCFAPSISADGRVVAFSTEAANLADLSVQKYHDQLYVSLNPLHATVVKDAFEKSAREEPTAGTIERNAGFVLINGIRIPVHPLMVVQLPAEIG